MPEPLSRRTATVPLTRWVDGFYDDGTDEAEELTFRAGTDEHGWVYIEIEPGRVLALRPSNVLGLIAGTLP